MKRYISLTAIVAFLVFTACDKLLDLEPSQSISEDIALTSDANVKSVLIGAYALFDDPGIYGGNILRNAELLGGNGEIQWVGTYIDPRQIFNKTMLATNSEPYAQWRDSYEVINTCNNILSALGVVKEADRDRVEGEALFLRALMYFDLVRFFAQPFDPSATNNQLGVPIVLTPTRGINESSNVGRNTVDEVYAQVITDLTTAAGKLPESNGVYASKGAVNALLARVYLQKGDYDNARKAADAVIASGKYQILPNYADVFNQDNNTNEDIFATQITPQDRFSSMTEFFSIPEYGGRDGDIDILDGHLDLYPAGDKRKDLFFMGNGAMRTGKWNNQYGCINLFRLAEMYLIRAEGNIRLGTPYVGDSPLNDYNVIHTRAGLVAAGSVTLDDIILERRLELAFEGHRIHDIKRLKQSVATWAWNDPKLVFPIPARELEANPTLKTQQNPGY
ncbi:MAG TPA: RagB/SusD family nutrient uptake outer membrane protein [Bacteroidales bacterium]|nr:RagB/SusD family nutrient uptake outer membrane protein [Bacteroidales bacterium]HRR93572.1 RagB/SusD family nutrient uptake outer membrane protein [Bacteroidales bacterium]HRT89236.1 RagB/SusD family nutrient uptake outer membrane protein [Bacteroidales bacterium]